jgi:UDP-N-acetyl-D-galactosamine dehydrogenase
MGKNFVKKNIAIIGLGYVGLPLAISFGKKYTTYGFDISDEKISNYKKKKDPNNEVSFKEFLEAKFLKFSNNVKDLKKADFVIIAVPTPIDAAKIPDLNLLKNATKTIAKNLKKGSIIIFEPTVYPGVTEEICVPIIEKISGLSWKKDFFVAYSPERINPGDKINTLTSIIKIVAGDCPSTLKIVSELYESIIDAGIFKVSNIKIAEAAKVIENTQRDVNIALINELAVIFNKLGIDTQSVLDAAGTKWNFIPFVPGLVGGHCIGVDPYYLTHKAITVGYQPEMILSGRRINDSMGSYIADQVAKLMIKKRIHLVDANILIMGLTFKENSPDLRNTGVANLVTAFQDYDCNVDVYDPWVDKVEAKQECGIEPITQPVQGKYDAILLAVAHDEFKNLSPAEIRAFGKKNHVTYDIKYLLDANEADGRL